MEECGSQQLSNKVARIDLLKGDCDLRNFTSNSFMEGLALQLHY